MSSSLMNALTIPKKQCGIAGLGMGSKDCYKSTKRLFLTDRGLFGRKTLKPLGGIARMGRADVVGMIQTVDGFVS